MGIATTELAGGESFQFYVPDGTSGEQAERLAPLMLKRAMMGVDVMSPPPPPDRTMFGIGEEGVGRLGEVGGGITSGLLGILGSGALGASFLLPEGAEQAVRQPIRDFTKAIQAPFAPKRGYEDSLTRKLSEGVGSTIPFLAAGVLSGGSAIPGLAAATALAGASGTGQAAERAIQAGATEEQISKAAGLGLLPGLSEVIVPFGVGRGIRAFRQGTKAGRKAEGLFERALGVEETQTIRRRLTRVLAAAGGEGLQEASAEVAQNLIARDVYDPTVGAFEGTGESFGLGAGVGGLIQGLAELAIRGGRAGAGAAPLLALPAPSPVSVIPPGALPAPQGRLPAPTSPPQALSPPPPPVGTQGELFPIMTTLEGEQIVDGKPIASSLTAEDLLGLGIGPNWGIVSGRGQESIIGRDLSNFGELQDVRDALLAHMRDPRVSKETKENIARLLNTPQFAAVTVTQTAAAAEAVDRESEEKGITLSPSQRQAAITVKVAEGAGAAATEISPDQITLENIITTSQEEEAWNAREERRLQQQARIQGVRQEQLDREAAQEVIRINAAQERTDWEANQVRAQEQRAANEAVRGVGRPPAGAPTAMGAAMTAAEATGRRGPDGRQLEIPTIPQADTTSVDAQIAAEQRRIEIEGRTPAAVPATTPAPVQGEMIGPRGGARRAAEGFNQPRVRRQPAVTSVKEGKPKVKAKTRREKIKAKAEAVKKEVKAVGKKVGKGAAVVGAAVGVTAAKTKAKEGEQPKAPTQKRKKVTQTAEESREVVADYVESANEALAKRAKRLKTESKKAVSERAKGLTKKRTVGKDVPVTKKRDAPKKEVAKKKEEAAAPKKEEAKKKEVVAKGEEGWVRAGLAREKDAPKFKQQLIEEGEKIGRDIEKQREWDRQTIQEREGASRPRAITATSQNLSMADQKAIRDAEGIVGEYFKAYQGPLAQFFPRGEAAPGKINVGDQKIANTVLRAMAADAALNDVGYSKNKLDKMIRVKTRAKAGLQAAEWVEANLNQKGRNQFNKYREEHKEYYEIGDDYTNRVMSTEAMLERRKVAKKKEETDVKEEERAATAETERQEKEEIKVEADLIKAQKARKKVTEIEEGVVTALGTPFISRSSSANIVQEALAQLDKIKRQFGIGSKSYQKVFANIYQRDPELLDIQRAEYAARGGETTTYSLAGEQITDNLFTLPKYAIAATMSKAPRNIINAIRKGDIKRVYQILSESPNSAIASMAQGILDNLGTTKIRAGVRRGLAGGFLPVDNTIVLDLKDPTNVSIHTLLHEGAHAVTSHTIADPTKELDPYVKQLRRIYESVKDRLSSAYGSQNLDEFVAEAYSNMEFRAELNRMLMSDVATGRGVTPRATVWSEVSRIFNNFIRRMMGKSPIPKNEMGNPLDYVDNLIQSILNPAPATRDAPLIPMASPNALRNVGAIARMKVLSPSDLKANISTIRNWLKDVSSPIWNLVTEFLSLNVLVDIYKDEIPSLDIMFKEIQKKVGARQKYMAKTKDVARHLRKVFKGQQKLHELFNKIIATSTLERVDPSRDRDYYAKHWVDWKRNIGTEAKPIWRTQPAKSFNSADDRTNFIEANKLNDPDNLNVKNLQRWGGSESKAKEYDKLQVLWKQLGKGGPSKGKGPLSKEQQAYVTLRDAYATMYDEIMRTMEKRINQLESDPTRRKTLSDRIFSQIAHKSKIEPYFPLFRKGKYWLEFTTVGNPNADFHKMLFGSRLERAAFETRLRETKTKTGADRFKILKNEEQRKNSKLTSGIDQMNTGLAFKLLQDLDRAGASQETKDRMMEVILDTMPESSVIQMFRKRKETPGFDEDAISVFEQRMPTFATQLVNLKYDLPMQDADAKIREEVKEASKTNSRISSFYENTIQGYMKFVGNPELSTWSKALKSAGFAATLGVNVSSVLVNATNLPIVVFPYLGGKYGYDKAGTAMNDARRIFMRTGSDRKMTGFQGEDLGMTWDGPNLTNVDWSDPKSIPDGIPHHLAELSRLLDLRGQANRSTVGDMIDYDNPTSNMWMKFNNTMGFMFHQGERFNRQVTAIASYELQLDKLAKKKGGRSALRKQDYKDAAEQALYDIEITNSGAMTETAGRLAQGNLGSVALMYKRFGISMYYLQFKMAREAMLQNATLGRQSVLDKGGTQKEADAEFDRIEDDQRAARRQVVGLFGMSGLMAGVQGLPLYGLVALIGNTVFLDDEDDDFDSIMADFVGEGFYSGAINHITNLDVAPRIGMTNLVYRTLPNRADQHAVMDFLEFMGGPVYGIGKRWIDGASLAGEGEIQRGVEKMLPSFASNPLKAWRYATEGATTMRGDPITEDIGPWNIGAQAFGLVPASYTKQLELNAVEKRKERVLNEKRTNLLRNLYHAVTEEGRDADAVSDVMKDIVEFSKEHPYFSINGRTINRSIQQHIRTTAAVATTGGVTFSSRNRARVEARMLRSLGMP